MRTTLGFLLTKTMIPTRLITGCFLIIHTNGGFARAMQGLKKYAPLGELRAALFSCLLSVEYISHHLDIQNAGCPESVLSRQHTLL